MSLTDPIKLLHRTDKWYLGNAGMLLYAPPFPRHLDVPGFWDECHYGDLVLKRLLCVSFVAEYRGGRFCELFPYINHWHWYPDRIEVRYYLAERDGVGYKQQRGVRIFANETRRLGPDGTVGCDFTFDTLAAVELLRLHAYAWTVRDNRNEGSAEDFQWDSTAGTLGYRQALDRREHGRGETAVELTVALGGDKPRSVQVTPSHGAHLAPNLAHTPFWDGIATRRGDLTGEVNGENVLGGTVYAGLHWRINVTNNKLRPLRVRATVRDPRRGSRPIPRGIHAAGATPDASRAWREFINLVPHFECSDELLTRYYWYRWYGLRLNTVPAGGNYTAPAVTEGIAYFRGVITYSLMCHMNECRWLKDPALARGCLENHLRHQTAAGHFAGHIYLAHVNDRGFYHTDVGTGVAGLLSHHPDTAWAAEIRPGLDRLLGFYRRERDGEGLNLYDVRDQFETGQEFTSRYFHGDDQADLHGWDCRLRLKGVDVTTYVYHLALLLRDLTAAAGELERAREYAQQAELIRIAVKRFLWDDARGFFVDYHVGKRERSPYRAAVGFYPLLSDLADDETALRVAEHLDDPAGFQAPWPVPTVPRDDPHYSADPRWRGERANCPWNGRVWPMVNSHLAGIYERLAGINPGTYRPRLVKFLRRYIEMMHFESAGAGSAKDYTRPNCFEHYSPADGSACEYRGIDDYQHSWVADLILKYVAGVRLKGNTLTVDPYDFGLEHFVLLDCRVRGRRLDVCWGRDRKGRSVEGYRMYLDGKVVFKADKPEAFTVEL